MPQNEPYTYTVTINGEEYDISSPRELSDVEAYQHALTFARSQQSAAPANPVMSAAPETGFVGGFLNAANETISGMKALGTSLYQDPAGTLKGIWAAGPGTRIPQTSEEIRAARLGAAERQGQAEAPFGERLGRGAEIGAEFLLPMVVGKAIGGPLMRGIRSGPAPKVPPPGMLVPGSTPSLERTLIDALESTRTPTPPTSVSLPPQAAGLPATADAAETIARQGVQRVRPPIEPPTPVPPAAPLTAPITPTRTISGPTRVGPTMGEMREAYGAERTAGYLNEMPGLREDIGMPVTREMVQDITGGPSHVPTSVTNLDLDAQFARLIADERGGMELGMLKELNPFSRDTLAGAARRELMLRNLAVPKSIVGNVGAIGSAALEGSGESTFAPIREALRLPTNIETFGRELFAPSSTLRGGMEVESTRKLPGVLTPFSRVMGAMDMTTQEALTRAGVPAQRAKELLLTNPEGAQWVRAISGEKGRPVADALFPFQRTPGNFIQGGMDETGRLFSEPLSRRTALTAGAVGAGAAGHEEDPLTQIFMATLAGRRGLPFIFGSSGASVLHGEVPSERILSSATPLPAYSLNPRFLMGF